MVDLAYDVCDSADDVGSGVVDRGNYAIDETFARDGAPVGFGESEEPFGGDKLRTLVRGEYDDAAREGNVLVRVGVLQRPFA